MEVEQRPERIQSVRLTSEEMRVAMLAGSAERQLVDRAEQGRLFDGGGVAQPRKGSLVDRIRGRVERLLGHLRLG